ncbi:MAG: hypothetical protein AAF289_20805 [Cyanobacteria bacterium P01_A01_bin.135]
MTPSYDCVLILEQQAGDLRRFEPVVEMSSCRLLITHSPADFLTQLAQIRPYLMLLVGPCCGWPADFSNKVSQLVNQFGGTVIALTEDTDEQASDVFLQQKDAMVHGCLVKPLNEEVFLSIMHAAKARRGLGVLCS